MMCIALCPGSFDPVTNGHIDIIQRSAKLFEKVIVIVSLNSRKQSLFTLEERCEMLRRATSALSNVQVDSHAGLITEYAANVNAGALVKGLRAMTDFEYEFQMALINKKISPHLETVFINTSQEHMYLSSSMVREIACYGGDLSDYIPSSIEEMVRMRFDGLWGKDAKKQWGIRLAVRERRLQ